MTVLFWVYYLQVFIDTVIFFNIVAVIVDITLISTFKMKLLRTMLTFSTWSWGWGVCNFHLPWGHLAKTGDAVTEKRIVLLVPSGWRLGVLLNILRCPGKLWLRVLKLRNPVLNLLY